MIARDNIAAKIMQNLGLGRDQGFDRAEFRGFVARAVLTIANKVGDIPYDVTITTVKGQAEYEILGELRAIENVTWPDVEAFRNPPPDYIPPQLVREKVQHDDARDHVDYWSYYTVKESSSQKTKIVLFDMTNVASDLTITFMVQAAKYTEYEAGASIPLPSGLENALEMRATQFAAMVHRKDEVGLWKDAYEEELEVWVDGDAQRSFSEIDQNEVRPW